MRADLFYWDSLFPGKNKLMEIGLFIIRTVVNPNHVLFLGSIQFPTIGKSQMAVREPMTPTPISFL